MKIGSIDVEVLTDGYFHLDGGAMFGVVPRPLWERKLPPDERNRVRLALRSLLIRAGGKTIVVDTGIGQDKLSGKEAEYYRLEREGGLVGELAARGLRPDAVDVVVDSHLHFDHCGGNTTRQGDRVRADVSQRRVLDPARRVGRRDPPERAHPLDLPRRKPAASRGLRPTPWSRVRPRPSGGALADPRSYPSPYLDSDRVRERLGDFHSALPFMAHLERVAWVAAVDTEPLVSMETKRRVVADALANNRLVLFDHDPNVVAARLVGTTEKYEVVPGSGSNAIEGISEFRFSRRCPGTIG